MALQFLDEQTAEKLFEHTFIKWLEFGYKGCYSPRETERELVDTTAWAWNSKTARDLMAAVTSSEKKIFVVGMRGGLQCFNSTEGPDKDMPVVFVDLDGATDDERPNAACSTIRKVRAPRRNCWSLTRARVASPNGTTTAVSSKSV